MRLARVVLPGLFTFILVACGSEPVSGDHADTIGADTGDNCPLPEEAPDATGDQDIMLEALEQVDTEGSGWSAAARHDSGNDCITVTTRTGGEEILQDELEAYREDIAQTTGLDSVRVVQDDSEPDRLDN